jgi:hypothetical protein
MEPKNLKLYTLVLSERSMIGTLVGAFEAPAVEGFVFFFFLSTTTWKRA